MPNVETILLVVIGLVVLFVVVAMLRAVRIVPQSYAIIGWASSRPSTSPACTC